MATWVVGDIQGCFGALKRLLESVAFDPAVDALWSVGDLVNRGEASLETLRFFASLGTHATVVLGNHDLHLLAVAGGVVRAKRSDTFEAILEAPDREQLLDWLRKQPLLVEQRDVVLVHAGLHPSWTVAEAAALARLAEVHLRGEDWREFIALSRAPEAGQLRSDAPAVEAGAAAMSILTRIRICNRDGYIDHSFKDVPERVPAGFFPWYDAPERRSGDWRILFGHWAALGQRSGANWTSLDAGCVWGQRLCMMNLETGAIAQVPAKQ